MTISEKSQPHIWAVVPAAGIGSRMGSSIPKQYLQISGKTILEITLSKLVACNKISKVIVALHPEDQHFQRLPEALQNKVLTVEGGAERADSVLNGIRATQTFQRAENAWILVHDAARPCVSLERITALCELASASDGDLVGGILASPAADTLKMVDGEIIQHTLDRVGVWHAHTPQLFPLVQLENALASALEKGLEITDEASAIEAAGHASRVVADRRDNIKITVPEDLSFAEQILQGQSWL